MSPDFKNYEIWNQKPLLESEFWSLADDSEKLKHLATVATLAANSHNTQPWIFEIDKKNLKLTLYIDTRKVLPISDVKGRQAVLSVGCASANFEVAAAALNCKLKKTFLLSEKNEINHKTTPIPAIEYSIESKCEKNPGEEEIKLYNACFTRRVDRGEYNHDKKIDENLLAKIESLGSDLNVKTILISDWGRKVALAELQAQADSFVINNKKFSEEFVNDWLIENNSQSFYGMPGNTFRLNDQQTNKIKERFKNNLGFESDDAVAISQLGKKGILSCQCVGMLIVESDTAFEWLNAGFVLQKGALLFEANSISWAVHAGLAEVSQVNMLMLRPIALTTKRPVVLFRAGYLKSNETRSPHSPRNLINHVWKEKI